MIEPIRHATDRDRREPGPSRAQPHGGPRRLIEADTAHFAHPLADLPGRAVPVEALEAPEEQQTAPDSAADLFPRVPAGIRQLLYTPEQAAVLLAVRPSWLRRTAGAGEIACTYLGKHLRFSDADLHAIIADNAFGPRAD